MTPDSYSRVEHAIEAAAQAIIDASVSGERVDGRAIAPLRRREAFRYAGAALATLPDHVLAALRAGPLLGDDEHPEAGVEAVAGRGV